MEDKLLIKMPNDTFDKMMCEKFPELFQDRNKPMNQTCMCWGFNIGEGWNQLLFDLCEKLDTIRKYTGIVTVFDQIKEKFGGGRFYYHVDTSACNLDANIVELWVSLIDSLVGRAERESDETCATCGERYFHDKIAIGGWVYDACEKCIVSGARRCSYENPGKMLEEIKQRRNRIEIMHSKLWDMAEEELSKIEALINGIKPDSKC